MKRESDTRFSWEYFKNAELSSQKVEFKGSYE